jgi:hypothetical protein
MNNFPGQCAEKLLATGIDQIGCFNRILKVRGKPTNIAIWGPLSDLAVDNISTNRARYYLRYDGKARKIFDVRLDHRIDKIKLCFLAPGFNGGPFDLFHIAEVLAANGYWVISAGCYIAPDIKPSTDGEVIARALQQVYPAYRDILTLFETLSGIGDINELEEILYVSFSSGIYPFLQSIERQTAPDLRHNMVLMSPGLSNGVDRINPPFALDNVLLLHSQQDNFPTYGCPLNYLKRFSNSELSLQLFGRGLHFDYVNLPDNKPVQARRAVSEHHDEVKQRCSDAIQKFIQGISP